MKKLFISYRRKSWPFTQRLAEHLRRLLYAEIFVDLTGVNETDFEHSILKNLRESDAVLVVVSEYTFDLARINQDKDWVRREIAVALELNKPIVLAGIDGQMPPAPEDLPENIRAITTKQSIEFPPRFFGPAAQQLAEFIAKATPIPLQRTIWLQRFMAALAAVLILLVGYGLFTAIRSNSGNNSVTPTLAPTQAAAVNTLTSGPTISASLTPTVSASPTRTATNTLLSPTPPPGVTSIPATDTPIPTVTANKQWTPLIQTFDGVEMALAPPGCFTMGTANPPSDYENEKPTTKICFDKPFWINKTEVTQAQFKRLSGTAAHSPSSPGDNRPVENITWLEARDFCEKQRGGRLPTEAEWEYAARGPDNLTYPWGNSFVADDVVYPANSNNQTAEVGSRLGGASWVGAVDLSGNVWEWVSTLYKPYPYNKDDGRESNTDTSNARGLRGGSRGGTNSVVLRAAGRYGNVPSFVSDDDGFPCARS